MGTRGDSSPLFEQPLQGGDGCSDAEVIRDPAFSQRDVEVTTNQDATALELEVVDLEKV
jgi:hypothetical protein